LLALEEDYHEVPKQGDLLHLGSRAVGHQPDREGVPRKATCSLRVLLTDIWSVYQDHKHSIYLLGANYLD